MDGPSIDTRKKDAREIIISGCANGLGIRIVGGRNIVTLQTDFGIFVKEVIPRSLADSDGRLKKGDQLLQANEHSLIGVSNDSAVRLMKECAQTNRIRLLVSRDTQSQLDFRRLSDSLVHRHQSTADSTLQDVPVATSTPKVPDSMPRPEMLPTLRESVADEGEIPAPSTNPGTQRSSSSSELTQISTTDIDSSHGEEETDRTNPSSPIKSPGVEGDARVVQPIPARLVSAADGSFSGNTSQKSLALSDVQLAVESPVSSTEAHVVAVTHSRIDSADSDAPPPIPLSAPPLNERQIHTGPPPLPVSSPQDPPARPLGSGEAQSSKKGLPNIPDPTPRSRSPPKGKSVSSPPLSAMGMVSPSPSDTSPQICTIAITKTPTGLGVIIAGGVNRPDGPHIRVDKILDGMDAHKDGQLREGDKIISVNGESFLSMTRERALTFLTQLKIRPQVKEYRVTFERAEDKPFSPTTSATLTLPQPPRTTPASVFDSNTLSVGISGASTSLHSVSDTPEVYKSAGITKTSVNTPSRYKTADKSRHDSLNRRVSMEPNARVSLSKLLWALNYIGNTVTPDHRQRIESTLDIDDDGKVVFADFIKIARDMFNMRLDSPHVEENLVMALTQKDSMEYPPMPTKATSFEQLWREYSPATSMMKLTSSHPSLPTSGISPASSDVLATSRHELEQMRRQLHQLGEQRDQVRELETREKENALREVDRLKSLLDRQGVEETDHPAGKMPHRPRSDSEQKRLRLMEAALAAARKKEQQMKETMRKSELELSHLKEYQSDPAESDLKKRVAVLDCQLRKEQQMKRRLQVTTEMLLQFVEECHDALVNSPEADRIMYHAHGRGEAARRGDAVTGNPRPPQYLSKHAKVTSSTLSEKARDTAHSVRKMLEAEDLPYGWEEAYTDDGQKYFLNHETQTTSWLHPVTKVNVAVSPSSSRPSTVASRSRTTSHTGSLHTPQPVNQPA